MSKLGYTWLLLANDQVVNQRFRCLKRGQGQDLSLLVVEGFGLLTGKNQLPRHGRPDEYRGQGRNGPRAL